MPAKSKDLSAGFFIHGGTFKAPPGLPTGAQTLWRRIMATTPEDQWRPGDLPLLALFCRVSMLAGEAVAPGGRWTGRCGRQSLALGQGVERPR